MSIAPFCEIAIGCANHPGEPHGIGSHRAQFDIFCQRAVLLAYARGVEIQVHAAQLLYQPLQPFAGILLCHVNGHHLHVLWCRGFQCHQGFLSACCHTDMPAIGQQQSGHFPANARTGSCDNSFLVHFIVRMFYWMNTVWQRGHH